MNGNRSGSHIVPRNTGNRDLLSTSLEMPNQQTVSGPPASLREFIETCM